MRLSALGLAVIVGLISQSVFSEETCSKDGGTQACIPPSNLSDWKQEYNYCSSKDYYNDWAYCTELMAGKYEGWGTGGCNSYTPMTEQNIVSRITNYANAWVKPINNMTDSGWGIQRNEVNACSTPIPSYYKNGLAMNDGRTFTFFNANNEPNLRVTAIRTRELTCPEGFQEVFSQLTQTYSCTYPTKILNCAATNDKVGNPCSITTGNKTLSETDWSSNTSPLKITRIYSSLSAEPNPWSFNNGAHLDIGAIKDAKLNLKAQNLDIPTSIVLLTRPDGSRVVAQRNFTDHNIANNSDWFIDRDLSLKLDPIDKETWKVTNVKTGTTETYQAFNDQVNTPEQKNQHFKLIRIDYINGQWINYTYQNGELVTAADNLGNVLAYHYTNNVITQIILPNGKFINYTYDTNGRLANVQRPGFGIKTYLYDEADKAPNNNPNLLTGIIDENGKRYATYGYDDKNRGILTEHAGNTQRYSLSFENGKTQVVDPYGGTRKYAIVNIAGSLRSYGYDSHDQVDDNKTIRYDEAGNIILEGQDGIYTKSTYDPHTNLETIKIEAFGTPDSRITLTEWASDKPLKTKITEGSANTDGSLKQALRITSYTYDDKGNALTKTITDPILNQSRTWTYTYNANNQKLTETNPQVQISKWEYNDKGFLTKSIDPQGLATTYSDLNADGKPQTITSPTGQVTTLTYDDAGRVLTQTVTINTPTLTDVSANQGILSTISNAVAAIFSSDSSKPAVKYDISKQATQTATTSYQYDGVGQLIKTTLPDGQTISYTYDDAHRMTGMTDSLGNTISYTLNGAGDIIQTDTKDTSGTLVQTSKQAFDILGRLSNQMGNNGQDTYYKYDFQGNIIFSHTAIDGNNASVYNYDYTYHKLQDINPESGRSSYTYNAIDQLLTVTDSNNATTTYTYNAFGDVLTTSSPDTGTSTNSYNDKGQLTAQTDGAGRVQNYSYDDKGRLTNRTDSTGKILASYQYDDKGRISLLTDTSGTTAYQYNSNNQVIEKKQTTEDKVLLTRYHYTAGGQLDEELLPSGQLVQYQYDKGILKGVLVKTSDGKATQMIDTISYSPNGIKGYNWSQTQQAVSYQYDLDGRLTAISDPALQRQYQYDAGNRITSLTDTKADFSSQYTHDRNNRLTAQNLNQGQVVYNYTYDYNDNRTRKYTTTDGWNRQYSGTFPKTGTNQYQNYSYDASGKVTNDGQRTYSYNSEGRIERIQAGAVGVVNVYNALGQRVQKNSGTAKTYFVYDESGKLISESDTSGNVVREYVYLGNMPIALLSSEKPNAIINVHSDHLGTPRAMTDSTNQVLWRWEGDVFGDVQPQLATVKMPLRMAGQYEDSETGLFYNYFRFYDPKTGRYVENDPIDLAGGLNRYGYVGGSPLMAIDPKGQMAWLAPTIARAVGGLGAAAVCYMTGACQNFSDALGKALGIWMEASDEALDVPDTKVKEDDCDNGKCPPCQTISGRIVPVGTFAYRPLDVIPDDEMQHGVYGSHHNIFLAKQAPRNSPEPCRCQWKKRKYVLKPNQLTPDMIPIEPFIYNGGI